MGRWRAGERVNEALRVHAWRQDFNAREPAMSGWDAHCERTRHEDAEQAVAAARAVHDEAVGAQQRARRAQILARVP
jgi:hypothetical protein